jgi:hypothetical protein
MNPPLATTFKVYTNTDAKTPAITGGDQQDRYVAARVVSALNSFQDAMDAAALAGLIIEPTFKQFPNRFKELGSDMESYVAQVEIYRKLG